MNLESTELPDSFVNFLKNELLQRNRRNPQYSLRSFAKSLNLSSSFLSKLLNGKRSLTEHTFNSIASRLALSPQIENHYRLEEFKPAPINDSTNNAVNTKTKTTQSRKTNTSVTTQEFKKLSMDQFSFIADWYHFALLELLNTEGFVLNTNFIASKLNISPLEAKQALDRLQRLGYIKTKLSPTGETSYCADSFTSIDKRIATAATLKQQKAFLEKAIEALTETPIENRSQTSMTMAISQAHLPEAEKMIHEFRRKFTALMQKKRKEEFDSVYQLSISFYPLTK